MFKKLLKFLFSDSEAYDRELMRLAQVEYRKDWEYAYYTLLRKSKGDLK